MKLAIKAGIVICMLLTMLAVAAGRWDIGTYMAVMAVFFQGIER